MVTRELYRFDQPPQILDPGYLSECWGTTVIQPYNPKMGAPAPVDPGIKTPEQLEKQEVPDPRKVKWADELHTMIKMATDQKQYPIVWFLGGWITGTAGMMVPLEDFMIWMVEQPDLAKKALNLSAEYELAQVEYFIDEFGNDTWVPCTANPTDSNVLIDANMFGEFPFPIVKKLNKKVVDMGFTAIWAHWCGDHNQTIDAGYVHKIPMGDNGILHFGPEVTMEKQVKVFGDQFNLFGNVDPPQIMTAEFDEWIELCRKNMEAGLESKREYALTVGCEMPPPAPFSNVYGMTKTCELYGKLE